MSTTTTTTPTNRAVAISLLVELANFLDTGLNETALTAIMDLLRCGVHPDAIVATVQQLHRLDHEMAESFPTVLSTTTTTENTLFDMVPDEKQQRQQQISPVHRTTAATTEMYIRNSGNNHNMIRTFPPPQQQQHPSTTRIDQSTVVMAPPYGARVATNVPAHEEVLPKSKKKRAI